MKFFGANEAFLEVTASEWNTTSLPKQCPLQAASPTILKVAQSQPVMSGWQAEALLFQLFPDF